VACAIAGYAGHAPWWHALQAASGSRLLTPAPTEQAVPALSSLPAVEPPFWSLYAGSALIVFIAVVMLWRCHHAGRCRWARKPAASRAPVSRS
jgi:hypothetical protein